MYRYTLLLFAFILFSCHHSDKTEDSSPFYKKEKILDPNRYNVAFLVMEGVYNTELTAPYDIFQHTIFRKGIKSMNTFIVADTHDPVTSFEGLRILADYNYLTDSLPHIDILVVPSAEHHLDTDLDNKELIDWVKKTAKQATYVTSHCDGAFILAKAGLLDSVASTTFPGDIDKYKAMFPHLEVISDVMFVHDGKYITSTGGARSFDGALYLAEHMYGDSIARGLAGGLVIDWDLERVKHWVRGQ